MKKNHLKLTALLFVFIAFTGVSIAQNIKVGYVDSEVILKQMLWNHKKYLQTLKNLKKSVADMNLQNKLSPKLMGPKKTQI